MNPFYKNLALWFIVTFLMVMLYNTFFQNPQKQISPSYTELMRMVRDDKVVNVVIQEREILVTDTEGNKFIVVAVPDQKMMDKFEKYGIDVRGRLPDKPSFFLSILISWFPMLILVGVWIFFMRWMQGGGGKIMSIGKSRARLQTDMQEKVTFEDVAGIDEAKEELGDTIEFLRDPKKFTRLGGRMPKGVLLTGSPGTGKTLLGRAIAGEACVPFFSISGSDFVEMFVGVGASRVRDLFVQGKKNAPCIIFIDEIDAVGRHRGAGLGGGHDEREQTLNQLLVEMDGFEDNEGVILIAATNRPDVLDPALLRPGRFDRQVVVSMPDIKGREAILKVHIKKTLIALDVKPHILAKGTPGFSGADLENLVNEAALLAAKRDKEKIEMVDFEDSKDKIYMGLERKSKTQREDDRRITAYHEGGHALVARLQDNTDAVNKITIVPRGRAAGLTWFLPEERDFKFKDQLLEEIAVAFGGRAAEEIIFNRVSTGAANDIKQATNLMQSMVRDWGMSDKLGLLSFSKGGEQIFLGREIVQHRDYSEATARLIDEEMKKISSDTRKTADKILKDNIDILHKLAELLLERETVTGDELDELIREMRPGIKLKDKNIKENDYREEKYAESALEKVEKSDNAPVDVDADEIIPPDTDNDDDDKD